ncbi:MAG: AI-2E family transporter [Candidatus Kapabacteria bacterium]|nr:AI-2E family transporter [Candidatus Kapabacteria bacterium]
MDEKINISKVSFVTGIALSSVALFLFIYETGFIKIPLLLVSISFFLIYPYRKDSKYVRRLILLLAFIFIYWMAVNLGYAMLPFIISFIIAYIFDPLVGFFERKGISRWITTLFLMLLFISAVTAIAIFVFPPIFVQMDDAIRRISRLVGEASSYLESRKFYNYIASFGIPRETAKNIVQNEIVPRIQSGFSVVLSALLSVLNSLSVVASQILNAIIIPVLSFYLLKDFPKIKESISSILIRKDKKLLYDLKRIDKIFRIYSSWQITLAFVIALLTSIVFSIFGLPFPIVLGVICGFLNPIPYVGILASMIICILTNLLVNPDNFISGTITIVVTISSLHFINSYLIEPNVAGKQVGLHPVVLIASLFVFGGLFGFIGLIVAVPCTAVLMMFYQDWFRDQIEKSTNNISSESGVNNGQ